MEDHQLLSIFFGFVLLFFVWIIFRIVVHPRPPPGKKRIGFIHLDLGIGGAERLVVDAALGLQSKGFSVHIFTSNHPKDHCFPETLHELNVHVHGRLLPAQIFNSMRIVCSIIRMNYVAFKMVFFGPYFDIVFCDGVSSCIPIFKLSPAKVIFYCHYPDQKLTRRTSSIRSLYRSPWNWIENVTTRMADKVLVNSNYTKGVYHEVFGKTPIPEVVYPCINVESFDKLLKTAEKLAIPSKKTVFLSLNRFDPAKNVELAVNSFAELVKKNPKNSNDLQLVIAGGYDHAVKQNVSYLEKLQKLAKEHGLSYFRYNSGKEIRKWNDSSVIFITDISEENKIQLMRASLALIYTPSNEHFGIVPVEAMVLQCPVIATASGGLLETVTKDKTVGLLCEPNPIDFANAMQVLVSDVNIAKEMGRKGRERASQNFSFQTLADHLSKIVESLTDKRDITKKKK
eukprot:TRINITY_DN2221_c0_g1_i1.p1 TRINITY_DN2221_c0_g1~~TRINITY_DN2221_c0_g1_i1.p1  ORF type:complete len:455 (-),score=103.75 TRINITY_DN2221_c0_g1_i1:76-1440(-)